MRDLKPHEIEVRVASENEKGASFLLHKTVRVDAMMLDEEFGKLGWTNSYHRDEKGILVCTIGVYDEKGRLVERSNSGIESQQTDDNKYKAEYSDAMKRCGFLWGIGSELYTSPFIWVSKEKYRTRTVNGKERFADKLTVQDIRIENKRITGLAIINSAGERVYYYVEQKKGTNK
ncbi:MAG: hypothetical protein IKH82_03785 [Clostridiales bacterium]|nr:hypothetical protein [Clostridiales bacterium]